MSAQTKPNFTFSACEAFGRLPDGPGGVQMWKTQSILESGKHKVTDPVVCVNMIADGKTVGYICRPGTDVASCKKELHQ